MSYNLSYPLDEEVSINVNPPDDPYPLHLNINNNLGPQWYNHRTSIAPYDEQLSPQHSSHLPTAPPSPTTPNSFTQHPSPYIPFDNLNFNTSPTSPQGLAQPNDLLPGTLDLTAAAIAGGFLADPGDKYDPNSTLSYGYPTTAPMDQLSGLNLFNLEGMDLTDGLLFGPSSQPNMNDTSSYSNISVTSHELPQAPTPLYINFQPQQQQQQQPQHLATPSLLQVPLSHIGRRHSDNAVEDLAQFRNHVRGANSMSSVDPRDTFGQNEDYIIAVPGAPQMTRSNTYSGRSSARAGLSRKNQSHSLRGRPNNRSSRTSSRNSSISRPSPYPTSAALPEHPEHDDFNISAPPSPHSVQLREELVELFESVRGGHELRKEQSDHVEYLLRLHCESVLNFQPLVSAAEPTAVAIAAQKRRRAPNRNENRKMFTCFLCARELTEKHNFIRHFLAHYGIKRFRCEGCGEGSTTSSDLTRHKSKCEKILNNANVVL